MIEMRFKTKSKIFDVMITAVAAVFSVGIMLYGIMKIGLDETWSELVLNVFYIVSLVMMWMYIFKIRITTQQFNCWCSVCGGASVLLALVRNVIIIPLFSSV